MKAMCWRDSLVVKITYFFSRRRPGFWYQHPHGVSQLPEILVLQFHGIWYLVLASAGTRHTWYTDIHAGKVLIYIKWKITIKNIFKPKMFIFKIWTENWDMVCRCSLVGRVLIWYAEDPGLVSHTSKTNKQFPIGNPCVFRDIKKRTVKVSCPF